MLEQYYGVLRRAGWTAQAAFKTAKSYTVAIKRAAVEGVRVEWSDDDLPWDGDCEAPPVVACATVLRRGYEGVDRSSVAVRFPFHDGPDGTVRRSRPVLAALGGIGLESWRDPYMLDVEAELLTEAFDVLDAEREEEACSAAAELAERATYASV